MPFKLIKLKQSKNWYIRGTVCGQAIYESSGTSDRKIAEQKAHNLEKEIWDRDLNGENYTLTFADAVQTYVEGGGDKKYLKPILEYFGKWRVKDITQREVDIAARKLYPNHKNSTIVRQFYVPVASVLHKMAALGLCEYKRFSRPKIEQTVTEWATPEWFEQFWPHCNNRLAAITAFLAYTGCRVTEACDLTWGHFNQNEKTAFISKTKTKVSRTVHLPETVLTLIDKLPSGSSKDRVFGYSSRFSVNTAIRRAVARTNKSIDQYNIENPEHPKEHISYLSSHKLGSHTYGTWMMRYAGLNPRQLLGVGRWQSMASVVRYTHTLSSEESRKADLLPNLVTCEKSVK